MSEKEYRTRLKGQLEEAYAKVLYTYQTQQEAANLKIALQSRVSMAQIVLTSLISVGVVGVFFPQSKIAICSSAALGVASLCLNIYSRSARNEEVAAAHINTADQLWTIMQDYVSLLTDFDDIGIDEIKRLRKDLQSRTAEVYSRAPRTDGHAYKTAQKAIKEEEVQSFHKGECKELLPAALRTGQ